MKRFFIVLLIVLIIPIVAFGDEFSQDEYNETLSNYDLSAFEDELENSTYNTLDDLGLTDFDYQSITSISIEDVVSIITDYISNKMDNPLKSCLMVIAFVILSCFLQSIKPQNDSLSSIYSTASVLVITIVLLVRLKNTIALSAMAIGVASDFTYAFFPSFIAITVASGGYNVSLSTNTLLLSLSQFLSFISSNLFLPISNCFLAIGICSSLNSELNLVTVTKTLKKIITTSISFISAVFVSILSIKTAVAARADMLGIRSIRFAINTVVPVIGSSISEGLLSIQNYSSLIKSSVGIVGIIAVMLIFLPSIIEVIIWRFCLGMCNILSDIFGEKSVSSVICAFKDTLLLINVVLILSMVTTIISIGILVAAGGSK